MRRLQQLLASACVGLLVLVPAADADARGQISLVGAKAVSLVKFPSYTIWPQARLQSKRPFVIGALGDDPNGVIASVQSGIRNRPLTALGLKVTLVDLILTADAPGGKSRIDGLDDCDMVFLSEELAREWKSVQSVIGTMPIVTVAEFEGFAKRGGMIELHYDDEIDDLRYIVNRDAMARANIAMHPDFLELRRVKIIYDGTGAQ